MAVGAPFTRQPLIIDESEQDPRHSRETAESTGLRAERMMSVPLLHDERALGVLNVLDAAPRRSVLARPDGADSAWSRTRPRSPSISSSAHATPAPC